MAAIILGVLSIILCGVPAVGLLLGVIAVIVGIKQSRNLKEAGQPSGLQMAGAVTGAIGAVMNIVVSIFMLVFCAGFSTYTTRAQEASEAQQQAFEAEQAAAERAAEQRALETDRAAAQGALEIERARAEQERAAAEEAAQEANELRNRGDQQ